MKQKICVVTGTRAEYGLLKWLMYEINEDQDLELQIIVTGMHLSHEFGLTFREIESDGFKIGRKVEMLVSSDTSIGVSKSIGLGMIGFSEALDELAPDILVVLGDRFEIFSAAVSSLIARIPVAHLHGGETTEGAYDESLRHSITKMAHLHFVSAPQYRERVIQLGENPENVFLVGGLGVDAIKRTEMLSKKDLEIAIDFKFGEKNILIAFHPVTLERQSNVNQMKELLAALADLHDTNLIFTMPNADNGGRELAELVTNFVSKNSRARVYKSLGQLNFLSCLKYVDGIVGNSSSGLLEAPSFGIGTVNIGDRQKGRISASSVIDCLPIRKDIFDSIQKLYDPSFISLLPVANPYGEGGASKKIKNLIKKNFSNIQIKKKFFDIPYDFKISTPD